MKKKNIYWGLLTFSVLNLIYNIYYWGMRYSGGCLRNIDKIICIVGTTISLIIALISVIKLIKKDNANKK